MRWSLVYLLGTLLVFFVTASADRLPSAWPMVLVPTSGAAMFALGYRIRARSGAYAESTRRAGPPTTLIALSALWSIAYGVANLSAFGAAGLSSFLAAVTNPGAAYRAKFEVFEAQIHTGEVSRAVQMTTLTAGLMTLLIPLTIIWWKQLNPGLRILAVAGSAMFLAPYAYVGTNQGFSYIALFVIVGVAVKRATGAGSRKLSRRSKALVALVVVGGVAYFLVGNVSRTEAFGFEREYNQQVAAIVGQDLAAALESAVFYPTHGYLGLAETMTQDFVFSGGYGSSRALTRYAVAYFGLPDTFPSTYPARTEAATGYPSDLVWHTIYPWIASDLTFFGAVALMGLIGWATAAWWIRAVRELDPLAVGLLGYAAILIAFVPANNQIGLSQVNLIGFLTLLTCYLVRTGLQDRSATQGRKPRGLRSRHPEASTTVPRRARLATVAEKPDESAALGPR